MFPRFWEAPPYNAEAIPLDGSQQSRATGIIEASLHKYPSSLLRENLDRIYLVKELMFSGISAGGTNSADRVYVAVDSRWKGFTDEFIENSFHHELSSILLRNNRGDFPSRLWRAANPEGFEYGESGVDAIKAGKDSVIYDAQLAQEGFFCEYAKWTLEDDFNTIVGALFTGDRQLWDAVNRYSSFRAKTALVIEFYQRLDPMFTEDYFRGLCKELDEK